MNKIAKIAIVSSSFPPLSTGGVSSAQYGLLLKLRENPDYLIKGFTFSDNSRDSMDAEYGINRSGSPLWFRELVRKVLQIVFKIIDRHSISYQCADIFENMIGGLKAAYKIKKFKPNIVFISDHGAPMFFIYPFVKSIYIWSAHHNPMRFQDNPLIGNMSRKDIYLATKIEKKCVHKCRAAISPSSYMKNTMEKTHEVFENSFVIPNIIDIKFLNEAPAILDSFETKSKNYYKIFIPSAGSNIKGERYILAIMQWLNSLNKSLLFMLSGMISNKLNYEIQKNKSLNVVSLGQQSYKNNIGYLKTANLCISPTLLENYGMAILEAVLLGIPVVAFNVGGNREIIINGKNGYLVDYLALDQLVKYANILINSPIPKKKVISNTKKIYSIENIVKGYDDLIYKLIQ